jgi:hypothetical protein
LFTIGSISNNVSYNSSQPLRFQYLMTSFEPVWTSNLETTLV